MIRFLPIVAAIALVACGSDSEKSTAGGLSGVALAPDTQTVAGVLEMRHAADALERAPQWTVDSVPIVVFDGGDDPDFDLSNVYYPNIMADGRAVMFSARGGHVTLFGADGQPLRQAVRQGEGPGEVRSPSSPIQLPGDTLLVADRANRRMNWITADSGMVRSVPLTTGASVTCYDPASRLPGDRIVAVGRCSHNQTAADGSILSEIAVVSLGLDHGDPDTLAMIPGYQKGMVETRYNGNRYTNAMWYRLGRTPIVMVWDGDLVTANAGDGFTITRRDATGHITSRLIVEGSARPVTQAMRDSVIVRELRALDAATSGEGTIDLDESRRLAREVPFVDSLAAFYRLTEGSDGALWALGFRAPVDPGWTATAFRRDGTLLGRLTVSGDRMPVWFGRDRVILRETDVDGVVRFGVYRIRGA